MVLKLQNCDEKYWKVSNQINLDFTPFIQLLIYCKSQYSYVFLFTFSSSFSKQGNAKQICHFPVHLHLICNSIRRKHLHPSWQKDSALPAERQVRDKLLTRDVFGGSCAPQWAVQTAFLSTYLWLIIHPRSWNRTMQFWWWTRGVMQLTPSQLVNSDDCAAWFTWKPLADPHHERIIKKKRAGMDGMFKCQKHLYTFQKQGSKETSKIYI